MPKMGESIIEATILSWSKAVGDAVDVDETVLEIATDKVDSEVPSPVAGVLTEIRFEADAVVPVGQVIAVIDTEGAGGSTPGAKPEATTSAAAAAASSGTPAAGTPAVGDPDASTTPRLAQVATPEEVLTQVEAPLRAGQTLLDDGDSGPVTRIGQDGRFYSPLVRRMAEEENISRAQLESIDGSGLGGRVNKQDVVAYLAKRRSGATAPAVSTSQPQPQSPAARKPAAPHVDMPGDEVFEMDRMRRLIADHMVQSVQTSPHVTSFVEADVTNLWRWRENSKSAFERTHGEKITFTPIFVEAVVKAIQDFPMINVTVNGHQIVRRRQINIGLAAALPTGNLIVPVIKEANLLSLPGLTRSVNDLANRARTNKLKAEDIQGGTFTVTNVGTFGNVMGTPIINQPQVAILATGAIRKRPAVLETPDGDVIAIRHMMFLSLSYDHRVVDGFLGGSFLRRVADYLEAFDPNRSV